LRNNIYLGEVYDARRELSGWDQAGFNDAAWSKAAKAAEPIGPLHAQMQPPIRITGKLKSVRRTEPTPGIFIFDMGQNFAGWAKLHVQGPAGTTVRLRFGELLQPDGSLNVMTSVAGQIKRGTENKNGEPPQLAYQSDAYVLSGHGEEVYTPHFTWHGFRYVEVTGYPGTPKLDAIEGLRLSANVGEAGSFSCSNEQFNRIQEMTRWTFLSNLFSVQSDCPHRERFGYGGDPVPTCEAFMFNFDMAAFYANAVRNFADAARPNGGMTESAPYVGIADAGLGGQTGPIGWQMTYSFLLEKLYQYYGDLRLVREQYPIAKRQMEFLRHAAKNDLIEVCIGDHESLDPKPIALTSSAFYYAHATAMARFAELLNYRNDTQEYHQLSEKIRDAILAKFFHPATGHMDSGVQAAQAFALHFNLLPPERRQAAFDVLVEEVLQHHQGHLATGIFGTRYLLETLCRYGRADVAYGIVNQKTFPGWGHMLDRGATTLWEHWEFSDNTFSHNHPMFGSVSTWFFEDLGGIRAEKDADGFDRIIVRPHIADGLTHAKASYNSIRGLIVCDWQLQDAQLHINVTIPPGVAATVYVPTTDAASVTESGNSMSQALGILPLTTQPAGAVGLCVAIRAASGQYHFESAFQLPKGK
jgi:alpha-L-rhamnosidase